MANIEIYCKDDFRILKGYSITSGIASDCKYIQAEDESQTQQELREFVYDELQFRLKLVFTGLNYRDMETYYTPEDEEEEEYIDEWALACGRLICELELDIDFQRHDISGSIYYIEGTANHLISFMERYNDHFGPEGFADDGAEGECFIDEKREFVEYLQAFINCQANDYHFNHLVIVDQSEYTCKLDYRIEDYDEDIYPDIDEEEGLPSLDALKNWFTNSWRWFRIRVLIPGSGLDYDDAEHFQELNEDEPFTEEESEAVNRWADSVETLKENCDIDDDFYDWDSVGAIYDLTGTVNNLIRFCEQFTTTIEGYEPAYPLREDIPEIKKWVNDFFPVKRLGFFDESLEDENPTREELEDILENNEDETACKILFNRDKKHVYTANAYVMLLEQFINKFISYDWSRERILNNYRQLGIEIFPSFEKYFIETDEDELKKVARELQGLNVKDYKWGILYGSGEEEPLHLNKALNDCGRDNVVYLWKSVKNQMEYIEAKGWVTRQKKLGFFDV